MRKLLFRLFIITFLLSSAFFLLSALAAFTDPRKIIYPALAGLLFPWLFLLQLVWLVIWWLVRKGWVWLPILAILPGVFTIGKYFELPGPSGIGQQKPLKVMSWNVKNFDLYNWASNTETKDKMMEVIAEQDPDILVLQEFYTDITPNFNNLRTLKKRYPYVQLRRKLSGLNPKYWGQATFSKYPIINTRTIRFANTQHNMCLIGDVVLPDDTITVFNLHLQSIYLDNEDYEGMEAVNHGQWESLPVRQILSKLSIAFVKRAHQVDSIRGYVNVNSHPMLICGDFNDTPNSYAYRVLSGGHKDAFLESGFGFGRTYNGPIPAIRIDHILYSPGIKSGSFEVLGIEPYSDHQPLVTEVVLE